MNYKAMGSASEASPDWLVGETELGGFRIQLQVSANSCAIETTATVVTPSVVRF